VKERSVGPTDQYIGAETRISIGVRKEVLDSKF
jgi:hypothetical protein